MKMAFFKIRAIAVFIMLASLATCGMLSNAPTSQIKKLDVQTINRPIVVIYSADWCGYCKKAKAFMRKNNIKFIEKSLNNSKDFILPPFYKFINQHIVLNPTIIYINRYLKTQMSSIYI